MMKPLILLAFLLALHSCQPKTTSTPADAPVEPHFYVGMRSSYYGFKPFPAPHEVAVALVKSAKKFPDATPSAVWIVGGIKGDARKGEGFCGLEFPNPDTTTYENILFQKSDKHEPYLNAFDSAGVKVFLQVEPGMADVATLIGIVFKKYGHHPSVVGFGVDVEWYPSPKDRNGQWVQDSADIMVWSKSASTATNMNAAMSAEEALYLDSVVKSHNPSYKLFLKHWEAPMLGNRPVSDVIYINDSQNLPTFAPLAEEFRHWARIFAPNDVGFQIGYPSDKKWWNPMKDPFKEIGETLRSDIPNQPVHLFWVDFTAYDVDVW